MCRTIGAIWHLCYFLIYNLDPQRIQKNLQTSNAEGVPMSLLRLSDDTLEAESVGEEISRIVRASNGLITYKDVAVLVRMNYMSRNVEQSLSSRGIPYVVVSVSGLHNYLDEQDNLIERAR